MMRRSVAASNDEASRGTLELPALKELPLLYLVGMATADAEADLVRPRPRPLLMTKTWLSGSLESTSGHSSMPYSSGAGSRPKSSSITFAPSDLLLADLAVPLCICSSLFIGTVGRFFVTLFRRRSLCNVSTQTWTAESRVVTPFLRHSSKR